jgi:hypothetical protein
MTAPRWDRTSTEIIGVFTPPASLRWVHRQLNYVHNVAAAWVRGLETVEQDPTAAALGMVHVRGRPDYPPLREALAQHFGPDTPVPVQQWWIPDVIACWHIAATEMRDSIPDGSDTVVLSQRQADAWKVVLPPLIVMFEVLRGVVPLPPDTTDRARDTMGRDYRPVAGPADHAKAQLLRGTHLGLAAVTSGNTA